uniref:Nad5_ii n=1 Tax=Oxytricha trifallax TaxID=1172189 RepID=G9HRC9_9SPIT|nr:nad5_ii [Oxytricha trifallax]
MFFYNQLFKIFKKINLSLLSFYDNRLTRSYLFGFFNILINNFKRFKSNYFFPSYSNFFYLIVI